MVRKVVWTRKANEERRDILQYWVERTKFKRYSLKLNQLFIDSIISIVQNPFIGRKTEDDVLVKIIKDYLLFYEVTDQHIVILSVWDSRRNPDDLLIKTI